MKKRVFALLAVAVLALCLYLPAAADFDPATRNSVVVVYTCLDTDAGEIGFGWGSGFFVGNPGENPTYLITNWHVIEDFLESGMGDLFRVNVDGATVQGRAKIRVYYDSRDYEEAYVVGYDSLKDVAILKLGNPTSKRTPLPLEIPTDSLIGSTVYAVGYPSLADNVFADSITTWGSSDSTVTRGTISRLFLTAGTGVSTIQLDCDIRPGNSGGPLVSDRNTALGINTWGYENSDGSVNYAVNIAEAITLLRQYSVPFTEGASSAAAPAAPAGSEGNGEGLESVVPAPAPTQQSGFPLWAIIVIAAVVVVAAAVAVILVMQSKKKQTVGVGAGPVNAQPVAPPPIQSAPVQATPNQQRAPARTGYVRSLSQQHRGNRVPVGMQPVLLGRGQDCAVVYAGNTPGVSGRHASLSFNPQSGEFTLTDLQSSYGTFLQNGQKLTPNMPCRLRSGDQFYLGEQGNSLQLSVE